MSRNTFYCLSPADIEKTVASNLFKDFCSKRFCKNLVVESGVQILNLEFPLHLISYLLRVKEILMVSDIFTITDPHDTFKGWFRYIFSSLVSMSNKEHLRNKEKKFYFTLKTFFVLEIIKF